MKLNKQRLWISDLEIKPTHKLYWETISSMKYMINTNSDITSLHVNINSPNKLTLPLGHIGYCETDAKISPTIEKASRVNNFLKLLDICQSTVLKDELSIINNYQII